MELLYRLFVKNHLIKYVLVFIFHRISPYVLFPRRAGGGPAQQPPGRARRGGRGRHGGDRSFPARGRKAVTGPGPSWWRSEAATGTGTDLVGEGGRQSGAWWEPLASGLWGKGAGLLKGCY